MWKSQTLRVGLIHSKAALNHYDTDWDAKIQVIYQFHKVIFFRIIFILFFPLLFWFFHIFSNVFRCITSIFLSFCLAVGHFQGYHRPDLAHVPPFEAAWTSWCKWTTYVFMYNPTLFIPNKTTLDTKIHIDSTLRQSHPQWSLRPKRLIFVALCNDLLDYFIVCFEHQCNTMRAF